MVRFVTLPSSSSSSVVTVSRCSPWPMRAMSLSHPISLPASAFFMLPRNSRNGDGFAVIAAASSALRSLAYPGIWAVLASARSSRICTGCDTSECPMLSADDYDRPLPASQATGTD